MLTINDRYALANKASEALNRIREKQNKKSTDELLEESRTKFDYSKAVFEEYSEDDFAKKVKFDSYIYNTLISEINEPEIISQIQIKLSSFLGTVKNIYEHINIQPKVYGFRGQLTLESSEADLVKEAKRIIFEHLDKSYYSLTQVERKNKYKDFVINESYELMQKEGIAIEESVQHIYKSAILSNLLENINFPFAVKCKIEELLESQLYKEIFDADKLEHLYEQFKGELNDLSRIFSLTV